MAIRSRNKSGRGSGRIADGLAASVVDAAPDCIVVLDGSGRVIDLNPSAERTLGVTREAAAGRDFAELAIAPADRARYRSHVASGLGGRAELTGLRAGGGEVPVELTTAPTDAGGQRALTVFMRDIADRRVLQGREQAVAGLGRRGLEGADLQELFRDAAETIATSLDVALAVVLERVDASTLALRAWSGMKLGTAASAAVAGSASPEHGYALSADEPVVIDDWRTEKRFQAPEFLRGIGVRSGASVVIEGRPGEPFGVLAVHATRAGCFGGDEIYFLEAVANVLAAAIERSRAEEDTIHRSLHDALTGLPNRALLMDRIGHAVTRARRRHLTPAVFFLDLDNFKMINDSLGHQAGDALLTEVAPRLRAAVRPGDTVARFGGDEFVILCDDVPSEDDVDAIAQRIMGAFERPFQVGPRELLVTPSVGVALSGPAGQRADELIRDADAAMYRAKEQGRGRYAIFDAVMRERVSGRLQLEAALQGVAQRGELRAFYQPLVELTGGIVGAEALLRWEHPSWGWLRPGDFIPVAEESDLIVPMGEWILRETCRQAADWGAAMSEELQLSVNLSARQLSSPELPQIVETIVAEAGIDASRIALEITETVLMEDGRNPVDRLHALKELGVRVVLDDFGAGYSSLTYLSRLPLDVLKLDRSFVSRLGTEDGASAAAIVTAVVSMASALDLRVVAEGVETQEQVERLADLGCELAQGFHFARPMAPPAFGELLKSGAAPADQAGTDAHADASVRCDGGRVGRPPLAAPRTRLIRP